MIDGEQMVRSKARTDWIYKWAARLTVLVLILAVIAFCVGIALGFKHLFM